MPHFRESALASFDLHKRPWIERIGRTDDWILEASDGLRWKVYHCRDIDGRARRAPHLEAEFRVFEAPDGSLRRYRLAPRERRDLKASGLDRQLQLAYPIERRGPPAAKTNAGWKPLQDGWDTYREHHGWGPPAK